MTVYSEEFLSGRKQGIQDFLFFINSMYTGAPINTEFQMGATCMLDEFKKQAEEMLTKEPAQ